MGGQHFLIVHEEPDDGLEVEHPDDCSRRDWDGMYWTYVCEVGIEEDNTGLDYYFHHHQEPTKGSLQKDSEYVPVGRHPIEYWSETHRIQYGAKEFDCGLRLSGGQP